MSGFGRILEDLNRAGVHYVLIGGIALIRHGVVMLAFGMSLQRLSRIQGHRRPSSKIAT